jgi:hypothetical protein
MEVNRHMRQEPVSARRGLGARDSVVGWSIMLQARRSRVRLPIRQLIFFNGSNPSSHTTALGLTQPIKKLRTRKCFCGVERGRRVRLTTLLPTVSRLCRQCGILWDSFSGFCVDGYDDWWTANWKGLGRQISDLIEVLSHRWRARGKSTSRNTPATLIPRENSDLVHWTALAPERRWRSVKQILAPAENWTQLPAP